MLFMACTTSPAEKEEKIKKYSQFELLPISAIHPQGWINKFLNYQKEGLTGNIQKAGFPFNTGMWIERINEKPEGIYWGPYEQTGYYIDGCIKCGYLLQDTFLINRAKYQVDYTMQHPQKNGRLGPEKMIGRWHCWPYAGFLRTFMTQYGETHDPKLIEVLHKHYLTFKAEDFQDELDLCNVEEICWLYGLTKDSTLLEMGEKAYELFKSKHTNHDRDGGDIDFASDRVPDYHGVVYLEIAKIPIILYNYTGNKAYLDEAIHGLKKMEKYYMLASGIPSSTEHFHGNSEREGHETCNVATLPYTYGEMLRVTGDPNWADKIEKAVFNGGIGSIEKDFSAHQYFSAPNQMIATLQSNPFDYNQARTAFLPGHDTECCTGNVNRFMPYYAMQMWLKTKENGIAAVLFGPSELETNVGKNNVPVKIIQTTKYPFDETISFEIKTDKKVKFDFQVRIPQWAKNPQITLNGEELGNEPVSGTFYTINRAFSDKDVVTLTIPMQVETAEWPNNGISIERGPIVYSLAIEDSIVVKEYTEDTSKKIYTKVPITFKAPEYYPKKGKWNYSLSKYVANNIKVIKNENYEYPWSNSPVKLRIAARKVANWELLNPWGNKTTLENSQTPAFPEKPVIAVNDEFIELVPYGSTKLRVTVFPAY